MVTAVGAQTQAQDMRWAAKASRRIRNGDRRDYAPGEATQAP